MAATLHVLRPQTPTIAGFLRVGHTGHRKLADLLAAGKLPFRRIVFDAAHFLEQADLAKSLRANGCEIVLDPNFAEMASIGKFGSSALQKLPWANLEQPWQPSDFEGRRNHSTARVIAEFAVKAGVNAVLSPSHLIEQVGEEWRSIDLRLCEQLRIELDRCGGNNIAVDFQLITTAAVLKDPESRLRFASDIRDLPVENVWVRVSGFGASSTGAGTRSFVELVRDIHVVNRPLIVDMAGGYAALGAAAFGAIAGISHGVGQKESFRAGDWKKVPTGGGGAAIRAYVPELDRYFEDSQLQAIFDAKGGRSRFGCNDSSCCSHGTEDMIENAHIHFLTQRHRQLDDLSAVPESRRAEHFLLRHLDPAIRSARLATNLKIKDEKVTKAVLESKSRMIRLRDALADLDASGESATRSQSPLFRGGEAASINVLGR